MTEECSKCFRILALSDGCDEPSDEDQILCWSCQYDEIDRLKTELEKFDEIILLSGRAKWMVWVKKHFGHEGDHYSNAKLLWSSAVRRKKAAEAAKSDDEPYETQNIMGVFSTEEGATDE